MRRKIDMLTKNDFMRVSSLLEEEMGNEDVTTMLDEKLARAAIIESSEAPSDLITMNSKILGSTVDGRSTTQPTPRMMTLVYPRNADISKGMISVLAPLGAELLGARVGQTIMWRGVDGCSRKLAVDQILYQPEASGDWHL